MTASQYGRFICRACGFIYDEARGDEDGGLAPGTRYADIPDDWACPLCGVTKADFEPYDAPADARLAPAAPHSAAWRAEAAGRWARHRRGGGVVIVGGGTAAWTLVERLRALDAQRPITLVSACSADRYDKPRLSVACKQGVTAQSMATETGTAAAARLDVRLLPHTSAVGADPGARRLRTTRGTLRYEDLVLAHGATPRRCPGLPDALAWRINDLGSYAGLRAALETGAVPKAVIIVGAGLVGCELANDLAVAGHDVQLLDTASRPLAVAGAAQSAALLQAWRALPIRFLGSAQVRDATRQADGKIVLRLHGGGCLQADVLISAIGLRTPMALARQLGLRGDQGIDVDPITLSTGVPGVHALGDCITLDGSPQRYIEPIHRQASIVAARLCGAPAAEYAPQPPLVRVKTSSLPLTLS